MKRVILWQVTLLALLVCGVAARAPAADDRPNIVILLADDLGFSDLRCYGSEIRTPNLDEMAKYGVRFTQFYNCGRGCPTRASLLTGLYPHETGVGHMMEDWDRPGYKGNLNNECVTIAELLQRAGYQTLMCGKWDVSRHAAPGGPKHTWPLQQGFERFYGTINGAGSYFNPVTLTRDNQFSSPTGDYYYTEAIGEHAAELIAAAARGEAPMFVYVAFTAPHWPLQARPEDIARYRTAYLPGWDEIRQRRHRWLIELGLIDRRWALSPRDRRVLPWADVPYQAWHAQRMAVYAAQVDAMDRAVGRVLEALRQAGREQNTVVMFLSDNGGSGEEILANWKGLAIPEKTRSGRPVQVGNNPNIMPGPETTYQSYGVPWANVSNTPFRLYKRYAHEGGIATPLIVRWPAVIRTENRIVHQPGHVVDIMPTCLELARTGYPSHYGGSTIRPVQGESLLPLLRGETRQRKPIFWEHEGNRAVRDGKWKLVADHPGDWELYDMEADRTELRNLAEQNPDRVRSMERLYYDWAKRCNVLEWPE